MIIILNNKERVDGSKATVRVESSKSKLQHKCG